MKICKGWLQALLSPAPRSSAARFARPNRRACSQATANISNSDSDESIADEPEADGELPVRRSTRSTAGHHSN